MESRNLLYYLCIAFFILLTFNPAALINAEPLKPKRSEFGEQCNSTIKCSKSSWLTCQKGGICGCTLSDEMLFESSKNKCVSKASERCKFEIESDSAFKLIEKAECVENSICSDKDGICMCIPGYFESVNGTCLPKGNFSNSCSTNEECKDDQFLKCLSNSTCGCNYNTSEFSTEYKQCVGLAEEKCFNCKCTPNATCNKNGTCSCNPSDEYYKDNSGYCQLKRDFGEACSNTFECKSESMLLSCQNGTCGCDSQNSYKIPSSYYSNRDNPNYNHAACGGQDHGYYSGSCAKYIQIQVDTFECAGLADKPCSKKQRCVENAQCNNDKVCKCREYSSYHHRYGSFGYSSNSTGMCATRHGYPCSDSELCSDKFFCTNGKCNCKHPGHQEYVSTIDKCISIISGPCSSDEECINEAFCDLRIHANNGICKCKPGFIENNKGECDLAHGARCDYQSSPLCDQLAELQCRNKICSCQDLSLKYDEELTRCAGLADSRCSITKVKTRKAFCVKNSSCVVVREGLETGQCKCNEGYVSTADRECALVTSVIHSKSGKETDLTDITTNRPIDEPVFQGQTEEDNMDDDV